MHTYNFDHAVFSSVSSAQRYITLMMIMMMTMNILKIVHSVSKKLCKIVFVRTASNFHQILIIFRRMVAKRPKLCQVHSFSTSSNLRQHTTVLNADVPNCHMVHNSITEDCKELRIKAEMTSYQRVFFNDSYSEASWKSVLDKERRA